MYAYRHIFYILLIPAIFIGGYALMHGLAYVLPLSEENEATQWFYPVFITLFALAIPFWMLKAGFHKAKMDNPQEKELHLKDLPKEKDALEKDS